MLNFDGKITHENDLKLSYQNRAFKYGDAIFDTIKFENNTLQFIEDHYFRIMSSLRMLRMKIPMIFTLEYYNDQIIKTVEANNLHKARIRVSIFRKDGGLYGPKDNNISFLIEANKLKIKNDISYEIDLFKDFHITSGVLSNIKTNNRILNVLAAVFVDEFDLSNCVLINENKNIVEAINANIFLIKGNDVYTPSLDQGCINGIIRKKIIEVLGQNEKYNIYQTGISPFELLKADEVFLTNSIMSIKNVTKYRKTKYDNVKTMEIKELFEKYFRKDA